MIWPLAASVSDNSKRSIVKSKIPLIEHFSPYRTPQKGEKDKKEKRTEPLFDYRIRSEQSLFLFRITLRSRNTWYANISQKFERWGLKHAGWKHGSWGKSMKSEVPSLRRAFPLGNLTSAGQVQGNTKVPTPGQATRRDAPTHRCNAAIRLPRRLRPPPPFHPV